MKEMPHFSPDPFRPKLILISLLVCSFILVFLTTCEAPSPALPTSTRTAAETEQNTVIFPSATAPIATPTPSPTVTHTPGPSPTSTTLPNLAPRSWQAQPIMVEAAQVGPDPASPFSYTPFFVLYGDGLLVKRNCQDGECRYMESQLDTMALCRLVNAIDRTGFLDADPSAFNLPDGTGIAIRLGVWMPDENLVQIPDLDRWITNPEWYGIMMGCPACFPPPVIDPAFSDLYRLLISYDDSEMTGLTTERLAVWLSKPVIAGAAQPWPADLVPLSELAEGGNCPNMPDYRQAVILDGPSARAVSSLLSSLSDRAPIFTEDGTTWQVSSRWLIPYEIPQTCHQKAGLFPPASESIRLWHCQPEMGAIPTATATITPTPTISPTPLR